MADPPRLHWILMTRLRPAPMIREVINRGIMPPWFAAADGAQVSPWANDPSLTPQDRQDLLSWIAGDLDKGDIADAPEPLEFSGRWTINGPDVVYQFPKPIRIKATGVMPYQHVEINTQLPEDKWVQEVQILPSEPAVVHHVLVFAVPPGGRNVDPINYWAGYVPGNSAQTYKPGYARRLPRGSRLIFQMHYTPNGTATWDQTSIGLRFAASEPDFEVRTASVVNTNFEIPPRAKNHQVKAHLRVPIDAEFLSFTPHHHLRGVAGLYELVSRNGRAETLLEIPNYDFNWQLSYRYTNPRLFKKGSVIRYTAWYDNSQDNPANPNPNIRVGWGPQTHDEMHVGYIEYAVPRGTR